MKQVYQQILAKSQYHFIIAFLLGAVSVLAFPPYFLLPVGILSLSGGFLLLSLLKPHQKKRAFVLGYFFGLGQFTFGLYWISYSLTVEIERFWWLMPFCLLGLPSLLSFFPGLAFLAFRCLPLTTPWQRVIAFSLLWTLSEWARGHLFTGFPWNLLGYMCLPILPLSQLAAVFGVYGLSFLVVFFSTSLSTLKAVPYWRSPFIVALIGGILSYGWGYKRLQENPSSFHDVTVRLVQPNIDQKRKWAMELSAEFFYHHLKLSEVKTAAKPVHFIIWPEAALSWYPSFIENDPVRLRLIADVLPVGAFLIAGTPRLSVTEESTKVWNGLVTVDHLGQIISTFDKFHLAPFGEYIPGRQLLEDVLPKSWVVKVTPGERDFSSGPGPRTLTLSSYPSFSPLICYEVIFPHAVVDPLNRPEWMLNLTNDAWFGATAGPYQHVAIARMRSIEEGLPLVRVANTGISMVVDAVGRIVASLPLNEQGFLDQNLPKALPEPTLYATYGDQLLGMGLLLFLALSYWSSFYRKRPFYKPKR